MRGQECFFFNFTVHNLYSCKPGVKLFVCDFAVHNLYSCGPGVGLFFFMIFPFAVYTLTGEE